MSNGALSPATQTTRHMADLRSDRKTKKKSFLPWLAVLVVVALIMWLLTDLTRPKPALPDAPPSPQVEEVVPAVTE